MIYYKFFIDNVEVPEVGNIGGWEKLITNIKRDSSELKGILVSQDVELTFIGDQYQFFKNAYFNLGICAEFPTLIQQSFDGINYITLHRGIIKLRDVVLVDMLKGEATAKINDDSFYARINNNKSISTNLKGGSTKNGEPITPCANHSTQLYNPVDNSTAVVRNTISVHSAMEYLIKFMSDDEVGFRSDFLNTTLPMVIQQGVVIRTGTDPIPYWEVSFAKLFDNISKLRKIGWQIEYDINEKPIFRLEHAEYFYSQNPATDSNGNEIVFSDPENLQTSVNVNELYGKLKIGSDKTEDLPTLTYPESTRFNGFKEEEFYILGQCNIDNSLDLTKDFVISSNTIEFILAQIGVGTPDTSHDEDLILIVTTDNTFSDAKMSGPSIASTIPPAFYNMDLLNSAVALNYFNTFQGGLVAGFLNFTPNDFSAITNQSFVYGDNTVPPIPSSGSGLFIDPIDFQLEIDVAGNFNLATDEYTAPQTGFYTFNFYATFRVEGFGTGNSFYQVGFGWNINGVQQPFFHDVSYYDGFYVVSFSQSIALTAGDTINVYMRLLAFIFGATLNHDRFRLLPGTKFSASSTPDTGGTVAEYDPQDVRNVLMKFKYNIPEKLFNSIKSQLTKQYSIYSSVLKRTFKGWIDSISHPHIDGDSDIVIKTSVRTINPEIDTNTTRLPAYRFEFDMLNIPDELDLFIYDSGGSNVAVTYPLSQSIINIKNAIATAFAGATPSISFDEIIIHRTSIAGAKFHYVIIILNPNYDIGVIQISGASYTSQFFYY